MKFLELQSIEQLTAYFSGIPSLSGEALIHGKFEAYSCKQAGSDKKLYKSLETQFQVELSKSPDARELGTSPFGPLTESASRKTLMHLISILNASFPDYDFCQVKGEMFKKESDLTLAMNSINTTLSSVVPSFNEICPKMWQSIDTEISLKECDIYSYVGDSDTDPLADQGNIWSMNYFFYNKKLKRILFVTFRAISPMNDVPSSELTSDELEDDDMGYRWQADDMDM